MNSSEHQPDSGEAGSDSSADSAKAASDWSSDSEDQGLSLDDLGAAYARVAAEHDPDTFTAPEPSPSDEEDHLPKEETEIDLSSHEVMEQAATPQSIVEGALFVGHPENKSLSEQRIASLMRDVTPEEVEELIDQLNVSYQQNDQALRIARDERGYRMTIATEVEGVRRSFLGKVREAKLTQPAIDVLALVAYQPGVTSQTIQDQRGQDSGSVLNQLVRRQLIKLERKAPETGGRKIPHYYITERFLQLFGLEQIGDLPQVEESFRD